MSPSETLPQSSLPPPGCI